MTTQRTQTTALVLDEREQLALHALMAAEPVPGRPLPTDHVLALVDRIVPTDIVGVCLGDDLGYLVEERETPLGCCDDLPDTDDHDGPLLVGFVHWRRVPDLAAQCGALPYADAVSIGFRNGPDHVSQISFDRREVPFSAQDLARLRLLVPVFGRLMRERPTPHLPPGLTPQERVVLGEVAAGRSNPEIAVALCIAPATVRKHLEHAYRKLGVTNRLAAVVRLRGGPFEDPDRTARVQGWDERSTRERV